MWWTWVVLIILIIILAIFLFFQAKAHHSIFQPDRKHKSKPKYRYENIWLPINTIDGSNYKSSCHPSNIKLKDSKHTKFIHCWYFNSYPKRKTVLFLHGNTGNISYRDYVIEICHKFKLNLLLVDYRGYGKSDSSCSITGVYNDSLSAYYYLRKHGIVYKDIIIWGESLGGAPAVYLASKVPCGKLILFSTFSNLKDLIEYYPKPTNTTKMLSKYIDYLTTPIPNNTRLTKVKCPVMIVHSKNDDLIGYSCAKSLYRAVQHPRKHILTIKGNHSAPNMKQKHLETLLNFCTVDSGLEKGEDLTFTLNQLEIIADEYQRRKHDSYDSRNGTRIH